MKKIEVVAAIFIKDNQIFCAQRENKGPLALKWEFPGGKIEPGESHEEALVREIKEELDTEISVDRPYLQVLHQYDSFELTMHSYLCTILKGDLTLNEHVSSCWLEASQLEQLDFAAADIPIVKKLMGEYKL